MADAAFVDRLVTPDRISVSALAVRLGVHPATVHRWVRHGVGGARLRTTKLGGRTIVTAADLSDFLDRLNAEGRRA